MAAACRPSCCPVPADLPRLAPPCLPALPALPAAPLSNRQPGCADSLARAEHGRRRPAHHKRGQAGVVHRGGAGWAPPLLEILQPSARRCCVVYCKAALLLLLLLPWLPPPLVAARMERRAGKPKPQAAHSGLLLPCAIAVSPAAQRRRWRSVARRSWRRRRASGWSSWRLAPRRTIATQTTSRGAAAEEGSWRLAWQLAAVAPQGAAAAAA